MLYWMRHSVNIVDFVYVSITEVMDTEQLILYLQMIDVTDLSHVWDTEFCIRYGLRIQCISLVTDP